MTSNIENIRNLSQSLIEEYSIDGFFNNDKMPLELELTHTLNKYLISNNNIKYLKHMKKKQK